MRLILVSYSINTQVLINRLFFYLAILAYLVSSRLSSNGPSVTLSVWSPEVITLEQIQISS